MYRDWAGPKIFFDKMSRIEFKSSIKMLEDIGTQTDAS